MSKMFIKTFFVLSILLLGACQTTQPRVIADRTIYHNLSAEQKGDVFISAFQKEVNDSLEFKNFKQTIEQKVAQNGFSIVSEATASDLTLLVSYGIDNGDTQTNVGSVPIFGQTGGGYTTHTGSVYGGGGFGSYSGSSYTMPTFGVVGSSAYSYQTTTYTRTLAIDILETKSMSSDKPKKVFEGRIVSRGCSSQIAEVMPYLLEAMFQDFPGSNGDVRSVEVPMNASSCAK